LALPFRAAYPTGPREFEDRFYVRTTLPPSVADQTVVIVNAPSASSRLSFRVEAL
jgi:hypothetical protein